MKIDIVPVGDVKPYPHNPRIITEEAITNTAHSIQRYGWRQPIVVDSENVIIVGHTRLEAAKVLGLDKVPIHVATDMSDDDARGYRIADNKTGEFSEWETEKLSVEIEALLEADLTLTDIAFNETELSEMVAATFAPNTDPDLDMGMNVTDEAVQNAADKLENKQTEAAKMGLIDLVCPKCGEEFSVDGAALVK